MQDRDDWGELSVWSYRESLMPAGWRLSRDSLLGGGAHTPPGARPRLCPGRKNKLMVPQSELWERGA